MVLKDSTLPNSMDNTLPKKGVENCPMCEGSGTVMQGEHDDIEEVPCPCTISEPADFSGATEGNR